MWRSALAWTVFYRRVSGSVGSGLVAAIPGSAVGYSWVERFGLGLGAEACACDVGGGGCTPRALRGMSR